MNLQITYKIKNKKETAIIPVVQSGILESIDNFLKYGIIKNNKVKVSDITNLDIIYEKDERPSQTSQRIASIVLKVIKIIKKF
jgi:hypothetical protein